MITSCGSDPVCLHDRRVGVSSTFFNSILFFDHGRGAASFVYLLDRAAYGRRPNFAEFMPDLHQLAGGIASGADFLEAKESFANEFVQRAEFLQEYPSSLSGPDFIDALLTTVKQTSGVDVSGERDNLIADYNTNGSRGRILRLVADNQAYVSSGEHNKAFVLLEFFGYLRRDPTEAEYQFWLDIKNTQGPNVDSGDTAMVCAFVNSAEYQLRFSLVVTHNNNDCALINPIDVAPFFVRRHYRDFLNREPDADGLDFWTRQITDCDADLGCIDVKRINVSAAYFLSIEFQQTGYLVYRLYKSSYGNLAGAPVPIKLNEFLPDTQKIGQGVIVNQAGWEQVLESNTQSFVAEFVQRSRFTSAFPTSITPAQFVDALFANAAVTPAANDRTDAINEFGSASTTADTAARSHCLRRVAENLTLAQQEFNRAFVLMQYFGYLRRNPNDAPESELNFDGYNFWLGKLDQFNGNFVHAEMVKAFITSGEYRQRFGP
jgi:hypothetical protein